MEEKEKKPGFFKRLVSGLTKTRDNIVSGIDSLFSGFSHIDDDFYEELEEILIMGDLGVRATESIIEDLQRKVKEQHIKEPAECKELLIESIKEQMKVEETAYRFENEKSVVLVIGVNGVGKTTTVGKLAGKLKEQGKKVVIAGADTFRAGASLKNWLLAIVRNSCFGDLRRNKAENLRHERLALLLIDTVARTVTATEIPLGILTALIGTPVFALVLRQTQRGAHGF